MKRPKIQRRFLARPVADAWELWGFGEPNGPEKLNTATSCRELDLPPETVVALPSAHLLAIPLWLASTDKMELRDMILLQLESKGFSAIESMEYSVLKEESQQTLVVAWMLPALPAEIAELEMIANCVPTAFAGPLADNACTVWKEAGRWTCAIQSEGQVVSMQALGASCLGDDLRAEILCLVGQLIREKCLNSAPVEIAIWNGEDGHPQDWPVPVRLESMPVPVWPEGPSFLPSVFTERRKSQAQRKFIQRAFAAAALLLGLTVVGLAIHTAWLWNTYERSAARIARMQPQVNEIKKVAEAWNAVAPAVDPDQSGVEILYRCARHIPSAGVRFTLFQIKDGVVLLVGEGDNVSGVVELQNKLANDKELAEYRWKMPPPKILPNNVARFEISGDRLGYATAEK